MRWPRPLVGVAILAAVSVAAASLAACDRPLGSGKSEPNVVGPSVEVTQSPTSTVLPSVEVTAFRGKRLDRVDDLRENSIRGPQQIDRAKYRLRVDGLVNAPLSLTYDEVLALRPAFRKVVTLNCVEGWSVTLLWEGIRMRDLLARAGGAKPGAKVVIFRAHDGYASALPLDYLTRRDILLAYRQNGFPLTAEWGWPLQLIAEDKWGYKWVKWIERVEVSSDTSFKGYWEQRGYSNDASLTGSYFGR